MVNYLLGNDRHTGVRSISLSVSMSTQARLAGGRHLVI
jgi:hypothetical protein